jgi:hypothetical protein
MNTGRRSLSGAGSQTAALGFGGYTTASTSATETWNGTSWTTSPTGLATARRYMAGCGTQTAALGSGGESTTQVANTEEFTGPGSPTTKTITTS